MGNMPGAIMGHPTHDKVMWKRSDKQDFRIRGTPGPARASLPKPESLCLTILCLSPTLLTLTGGYSRLPFSGKINLGLWLISLLDMIGVFQFKPLRWLSSLPNRFIQTLAATRMIVHSLPTVRGTGSLKHRAFQRVKSY